MKYTVRHLFNFLSVTALLFTVGFISIAPVYAQETTPAPITQQTVADSVCQGVLGTQDVNVNTSVTAADCKENGSQTFNNVIRRIINIFSIVVGAVSVIMIIIGGFRYIISGGDSTGVSGAKNTILYALVGLVIVLFAQVLVRFVVANLSTPTTPAPASNTSQSQNSN